MNHTIIITTVGASMFTNYFEKNPNSTHKLIWDNIKKLSFNVITWTELEKELSFKNFIKDVEEGLKGTFSCAELDTIKHIKGNNVEHYLLCSETIAGYLAGQILEKKLESIKSNEMIKKLQTHIAEGFKEDVFLDLVEKVQNITTKHTLIKKSLEILDTKDKDTIKDFIKYSINNTKIAEPFKTLFTKPEKPEISWKNFIEKNIKSLIIALKSNKVVINYSGGYKAIIPYLTILGQLYDYELAYMHEDSEELIEINPLPFNFDVSLAEKYYPYLDVLSYYVREDYALSKNDIKLTKEIILQKSQLQVKEMKEYNLVDELNKITAFGTLVLNYIREKNAISKSTLGHYCEYKMFEYFYDYHRQDYIKIERSFKPKKDDERNIGINDIGDADLKLEIKDNLFDWVEVKAFGGVLEIRDNEWRVLQRVRDRYNYNTSNFEGSHINKYKFILYKYENDELELVIPVIKKMLGEFPNLEVYCFEIKLNKNSSAFSSFIQNKMKKTDLLKYDPQTNKWIK